MGTFRDSFWLHLATLFRDFRANSGLNWLTLAKVQRCINPALGAAIYVYLVDFKGRARRANIESPSLRQKIPDILSNQQVIDIEAT